MDDRFKAWVRENSAELRAKARAAPNGHPFDYPDRSALAVSPQEREAIYEAAWERGGLRFRAAFRDIMLDQEANETASSSSGRRSAASSRIRLWRRR